MGAGRASREAALAILRGVRSGRLWDDVLADGLSDLPPADARLAHEIAAGVLRSRRVLDDDLAPLARDWVNTPDDLKDLVRIGAFQLAVLDRVPRYAAVQATVAAAKTAVGERGSRFVNALLRRFADRAEDLSSPPDSTATHPDWLVARWTEQFGPHQTLQLLAHNDRRPDLTLVPYQWSRSRLARALEGRDIAFRPARYGSGLVIQSMRVSELPGFDVGAFVVQDAGQSRLLEFAALEPNGRVWDACAAPGGKSVQLAKSLRVTASDVRVSRMAFVRDSLRRCIAHAQLVVADARHAPFAPSQFDAVLVDAPCTATGAMQRHPDARWRLEPSMILDAAQLQSEILLAVAPTVRRGGILVYLTCSLEHEENAEQVDAFLSRQPDFERTKPDESLFPPESGTDGGYGARLVRVR